MVLGTARHGVDFEIMGGIIADATNSLRELKQFWFQGGIVRIEKSISK